MSAAGGGPPARAPEPAGAAVRARSFGGVAEEYDRLRPSPPPEALAWLLPPGARAVLDLAAGTGLTTRALLAAGVEEVVAVEPDERMRAVLAARSPGVRALAGVAEEIPLPDASVDAVVVASAWHWVDPRRAVPEVARVLRDGGRFAAVWTGQDGGVDWVRELHLPDPGAAPAPEPAPEPAREGHLTEHERHTAVDLPPGSPFTPGERTEVRGTQRVAVEDLVALLGTYSQVITAGPQRRLEVAEHARAVLARRFGDAREVDLPLRARCWRADRLPRLSGAR